MRGLEQVRLASISRIMRFHGFLVASALTLADATVPISATAQPKHDAKSQPSAAPVVGRALRAMVGTWSVKQRMWPGPDAEPTDLPDAVARRAIAKGGGFVEETLTLADTGAPDPFTRTAHINYNEVDGVFEYFSIDSRAPQQMHYRSQPASADHAGPFSFQGGTFVAAEWGKRRNVSFAYRVTLTPVIASKQTLQLYLRPTAGSDRREFKAFEYSYSRR